MVDGNATSNRVCCAFPGCKSEALTDARYCGQHALYRSAVAAIRNDGWPGTTRKEPK